MTEYDPNAWEKLGDKFTNNYEAGMLDYRANIIRTIIQYQDQCENLLEIACADGWFIEQLRKNDLSIRYLGTDITPNLIDRAKARMPNEDFWIADATDLSEVSDKQFDFVLCAGLLMHLDYSGIKRAIYEACRTSYKFVMFSHYGTYGGEFREIKDPKFLNNIIPMDFIKLFVPDRFKLIEFNAFPRTRHYNMFQFLFMRGDLP